MKPLVVLVSGAPGAGKTTLASRLEQHMRLPHIPRDKIVHGLERTKGDKIDRAGYGVPLYYNLVANMLDSGISLITDGTIYRGISEADLKKYIIARAFVVNVHVRASNEWERFCNRELNREGWSHEWLDGHKKIFDERYHLTVDPLDLEVPVIEVDTNDVYNPSLADISQQIGVLYRKTKEAI